jgi:hypothetical protein
MAHAALTYGLLLLTLAGVSALFGYGAVGTTAGAGGKVLAAVSLALAALCFAAGWIIQKRTATRRATAGRWAAWSR